MSVKQKIINAYLVVWLLFALYGWLFGANSYRGFMYNVGRSLLWPTMIFPELGTAITALVVLVVVIGVLVFVRNPRK